MDQQQRYNTLLVEVPTDSTEWDGKLLDEIANDVRTLVAERFGRNAGDIKITGGYHQPLATGGASASGRSF